MSDNSSDPEAVRKDQAVIVVQRAWRKYSLKNQRLDANTRWKEAYVTTRKRKFNDAADQQKNDPKSRWERGVFLAGRLMDGDALPHGQTIDVDKDQQGPPPVYTKELTEQHWLELVDGKHRYGANLKWYHQAWLEADTNQNFFRWLDRGGGMHLSLPQCSREQLEKEKIQYLSVEQRLNYLVKIDPNGRLRWARNEQFVDTTPKEWKDAGGGKGIVRADGSEPPQIDRTPQEHEVNNEDHTSGTSSSSTSTDSSVASALAHHYNAHAAENSNLFKRLKGRFTTAGMTERLLRKTVAKNTWLYTADVNYNVFVGLKDTGTFQHSSFTSGGLVASAGIIRVRDGLVTELQPLSGHYRTSMDHFKQFLEEMDRRGLDLSEVHLTKGEIMLWGLEHFAKFQKRKGKFFENQKKHLRHALGKKTKEEKKEEEKQRKEQDKSGSGPGSDDSDKGKDNDRDSDKNGDEPPEMTEDKGKGKLETKYMKKGDETHDKVHQERVNRLLERKREEEEARTSTSRWRWEVLTGRVKKAEEMGEEKWKAAMEGETSTKIDKPKMGEELPRQGENPSNQAAQAEPAPLDQAQERQSAPMPPSMGEKSQPRRGTVDSDSKQQEGPPPYEHQVGATSLPGKP